MSEEPKSAFNALRQRRLFHWLVVYAAGAWGVVEATGFAIDNYGLSRSLLDVAVFLIAVFLPVTLMLVWYHGLRGRQRVGRLEATMLAAFFTLAAVGSHRIATSEVRADLVGEYDAFVDLGDSSVAVFPFRNALADPELEWLDRGLGEMLATHLAQIDGLRVVSGERIFDLLRQLGADRGDGVPDGLEARITRMAGARKMVTGRIQGSSGQISIDAKLTDVRTGEILASTEKRGDDLFALVDQVSEQLCNQAAGIAAIGAELMPVTQLTTTSIEAYGAYQQGREAQMRYLSHEAIDHLRRAVELDPTFAKAHFNLGLALHQVGNSLEGMQAYQNARDNLTAASERDRLLIEGTLSYGQDPRTGDAMLRELLRKYPDEKDGRLILAAQLGARTSGDPEARRLLREIIALDPFYSAAYNTLAYQEASAGSFDVADSLADRYIELEPGQPNPLDSKGEILEYAGRHAEARAQYREALRLRPDFFASVAHLVRSHLSEENAPAAREELQAYLESPAVETRVEAQLMMGDAYIWEGALEEGAASYQAADQEAMDNDRPDLSLRPRTELIRLYLDQQRFTEAESVMARLRTIDPDHPFGFTIRFEALAVADDREGLAALRDEVEEFYASDPERRRWVGQMVGRTEVRIAFHRGDYERALEIAGSMGELRPGRLYGWPILRSMLGLGQAEEVLGHVRRLGSPDIFNRPARLSPLPYRRLRYFEARALEASGDTAGAVAAYEAFVQAFGDGVSKVPFVSDAPERLRALS